MTRLELLIFVLAMISGTVSLILVFNFVIDQTAPLEEPPHE